MFTRIAIIAAACASMGACSLPGAPLTQHPGAETGVPVPLSAGVTSTYDAGGPGQYPATVWHYDHSVMEDEAGDDCDARGGSFVDDAADRFVCVTD